VWAFDAEWVPDPDTGRRVYGLDPSTSDADVVDEKLAADPWALVENRDEATRRLDEAGGPRENAHP